ncbi:hypothetical protein PROFUN_09316 [Planoprotostelium fungivorum]|uniref:Geranylgeranyl transferase type-1 subunit beta n=1 Tax=Planoprotostelium fungivorum TaxID=1890364 RepID=A0A2P6NHA1_9EUKA|nr:hypothetical protein PROFUN_09316 [Planoprotostelium fungivorum]
MSEGQGAQASSGSTPVDHHAHLMTSLQKYLKNMSNVLPRPYAGQDSNRLTLLYFVVSALDLVDKLDLVDRKQIIDWIYAQQVLPDSEDPSKNTARCGFRGGPFLGNDFNEDRKCVHHDQSHIAMTYTALAVLKICGDTPSADSPFSRVNKKAIINSLKHLQGPSGSFNPTAGESENDMRFVYCAAVISYMLGDFSGINIDSAVEYILKSTSYDYGMGQGPGQESHGGSTYCAVAALSLMNRLDALPNVPALVDWLLTRQVSGFQGRVNKPPDSCYSFWIGATLDILGKYDLVEFDLLKSFILSCSSMGGFAKMPTMPPDVLHTYMSLCGLSLGGYPGIKPIHGALGFSRDVADQFPNPWK